MFACRRIVPVAFLFVVVLISACGPMAVEPGITREPEVGPIVPVGSKEVRVMDTTTEIVPNCSNPTSPVIKQPSKIVGSTHTIEWSVGGAFQTGATVGGGVVPGEVDLQAAVDAHVGKSLQNNTQHGNGWELPADPGMIMEYTIIWREEWQPAYLDATFMDPEPKILRIDIKYLAGIQSEIVGEKATPCDTGAAAPIEATSVYEEAQPPPPQPTLTFHYCQPISSYPGYITSESHFPPGSSTEITVNPGEIHVLTGGPMNLMEASLRGGPDRGSVVIMLPPATYQVTGLAATYNWHGVFSLQPDQWEQLAATLAVQQMIPGTCDSDGCTYVDVLVVDSNQIILQTELSDTQNVRCN